MAEVLTWGFWRKMCGRLDQGHWLFPPPCACPCQSAFAGIPIDKYIVYFSILWICSWINDLLWPMDLANVTEAEFVSPLQSSLASTRGHVGEDPGAPNSSLMIASCEWSLLPQQCAHWLQWTQVTPAEDLPCCSTAQIPDPQNCELIHVNFFQTAEFHVVYIVNAIS